MKGRLLFCGFVFTLFGACSKSGTKVAAPAYLQIDDYTVITSAGQGTNKQKFTDVLVSSKSTNYGYYTVPGKIPLPLSGSTYLIIRPVIKDNGLSSVRLDYPLMKGSDTTLGLTPGQITKFKPIFQYYPTAHFWINEDFEGISSTMVDSDPTDTFCVKPGYLETTPFDGRCLYMQSNITHQIFQVQSQYAYKLPFDGTNCYVEINYKCNVPFEVGVIGTNNPGGPTQDQRSAGGANASAGWNKLYINLTDILRTPPYHYYWYLYFYGTYNYSNNLNQIYVDNVKLITQQ